MSKENKNNGIIIQGTDNTNFLRRYPPEGIFAEGTGFSKQVTIVQHCDPYTRHESITDEESYRLSLSQARGALASLTPEKQKGMYMFDDGKYDYTKDISYLLRKDLSIVEIDDYLFRLKENAKMADEASAADLDNAISKLEAKKAELANKQKQNTSSTEE